MEYDLSQHVTYRILCEGCDTFLGPSDDADAISRDARKYGYIAIETPDDGTLNFCKDCKGNVDK